LNCLRNFDEFDNSLRRAADLLTYRASGEELIVLRCKALQLLHQSLLQPSFEMRDVATRVHMDFLADSNWVARTKLLQLDTPSRRANLDDGNDLYEQLDRCRELIDRLRIGALELRCGFDDATTKRIDAVLASELSVLRNVAFVKCRNVLDQALTRFARRCVWTTQQGQPVPRAPIGVFQVAFGSDCSVLALCERLIDKLKLHNEMKDLGGVWQAAARDASSALVAARIAARAAKQKESEVVVVR
jgi:hypothetical protein